MWTMSKRIGTAAVACCGLLAVVPAAQAQRRFISAQQLYQPFVPTQLQQSVIRQWAFNTTLAARVYRQVPPYLFGYNPYPQILNTGPVFQQPSFYPSYPIGGGYANPYAGLYGGGYSAPVGYGGGYSAGYGGGYSNPYGGYIDPYGQGAVLNAYGTLSLQHEQARLMREQVNQAKLETAKKRVDTLSYIRDHTPTFGQEQERIARQTLQRIQTTATPIEIWAGKSQNIILRDLTRHANRKSQAGAMTLDEETLRRLNVTRSHGNMGLLRNNGQFTWPAALRTILPKEERDTIDKETQALVRQAANAPAPDIDRLRDLKSVLGKARTTLTKSVLDVPTRQYLDANRFLNDFDAALIALERGDAAAYL
ncbi:MAG: hypothetical protein IT429_23505, partial [Gemmataceae bacterium]|nr:hypothetical protein [Gemmataceae bacterium]